MSEKGSGSGVGAGVGRRGVLLAALAGGFVGLGGLFRLWSGPRPESERAPSSALEDALVETLRLVSLSPGVTETLQQLGLSERIVGISDYCAWPGEEHAAPRRVGSALTPQYEAIARLAPTHIIASDVAGQQLKPLSKLAPTYSLPWLSVQQLAASVKKLGELLDRQAEGRALSQRLTAELSHEPPLRAPRVLFAFSGSGASPGETWFIRQNSIHGAVLRAAGGRNAVAKDIVGQPKLSPEELLRLDPDVIIVLLASAPDAARERVARAHFEVLAPLRAVRERRVGVLSDPSALSQGPSVLALIAPLRQLLDELTAREERQVGP